MIFSLNVFYDEVDNCKSENNNNKADNCIEDGVAGFFGFAGVTSGSHILNTTDDNENNSDNAGDANNDIENILNDCWECVFGVVVAAVGFEDGRGQAGITGIDGKSRCGESEPDQARQNS